MRFKNYLKNDPHNIWKFINKIYSIKTIERKNEKVKSLKAYVDKNNLKSIWDKIEHLFEEEYLNKWTCLYKISTFRDSANNYLEKEFSSLNSKRKKQTITLTELISTYDVRYQNILIDIYKEEPNNKQKLVEKEIKNGIEYYKKTKSEIKIIDENHGIFFVESS